MQTRSRTTRRSMAVKAAEPGPAGDAAPSAEEAVSQSAARTDKRRGRVASKSPSRKTAKSQLEQRKGSKSPVRQGRRSKSPGRDRKKSPSRERKASKSPSRSRATPRSPVRSQAHEESITRVTARDSFRGRIVPRTPMTKLSQLPATKIVTPLLTTPKVAAVKISPLKNEKVKSLSTVAQDHSKNQGLSRPSVSTADQTMGYGSDVPSPVAALRARFAVSDQKFGFSSVQEVSDDEGFTAVQPRRPLRAGVLARTPAFCWYCLIVLVLLALMTYFLFTEPGVGDRARASVYSAGVTVRAYWRDTVEAVASLARYVKAKAVEGAAVASSTLAHYLSSFVNLLSKAADNIFVTFTSWFVKS